MATCKSIIIMIIIIIICCLFVNKLASYIARKVPRYYKWIYLKLEIGLDNGL